MVGGGNNNFYTGMFSTYYTSFELKNDMLTILRETYVKLSEFCCNKHFSVCKF